MQKNKTMMQYFEWYLPENGLLWERVAAQAANLQKAGINMVWLPPAYKGANGAASVGYDVYDMYDVGEFDQKGSVATKYGTKASYEKAIHALQKQKIEVLADVVLNHRMGADGTEEILVEEENSTNRNQDISGQQTITAWTKFDFPGRGNTYSDFHWNASHFSGTDWDENRKRNGIFREDGKRWNEETDSENGNYDYLMGADLDMDNPETVEEVTRWGKWYLDMFGMDGFRLDAVKHISFAFYRDWIKNMREHAGKNLFMVGEYWSKELERMTHYLDVTENSLALFDVTLHFNFFKAANSNGQFDMRTILDGSLVRERPQNAVTFVDNHDTQPGQALYSYIPDWFKPLAYALILLQKEGIPCVFYGDYYGIPHDNVSPVQGLKKMLKVRELCAYGEQYDYFDDASLVGFLRLGDEEHPGSGVAVLMTDSVAGSKWMQFGDAFAGKKLYDVLGRFAKPVVLDENGKGEFFADGGSVSVWVTEEMYRKIRTEVE
ncbi:MAG: alpha-amylase [Roseburia sp.]